MTIDKSIPKNRQLYLLLIGLLQAKLKEESNAKEQVLEMLFAVNEDSAALAWVLIDALELDLDKELSLFISNMHYSNERFYIVKHTDRAAYFKYPQYILTAEQSWDMWGIHHLSPLIKYRKNLYRLTISVDNLHYRWHRKAKKEMGYLRHLPEEIGELTNLTHLEISRMPLEILPDAFVHLHKLERIVLTHTALKELPKEISNLQQLQFLILSNNQFQTLPIELGQLKNLKVFEIKNNPLQRHLIPEQLFDETQSSRVVARALKKFFKE